MRIKWFGLLSALLLVLVAACQVVPSTGDTASDAAAAQNFLPTVSGYNMVEANSISDALTKVGAGASVLTGNLPLAGAIAKLDDMIRCYQGVGAVAARIYTEPNINPTTIPRIGAVAIINTTRIQRNLLACVLNTGAQAQRADEIQPCGGSGSFTVNNETLEYVFAATTPELCQAFQSQLKR